MQTTDNASCLLQEMDLNTGNSDTAHYFPLIKGRYEVTPGLYAFGTDFDNGERDRQLFQIDASFAAYHQAKLCARRESLSKYYQIHDLTLQSGYEITQFIITRLTTEHPALFKTVERDNGLLELHCSLTNEKLVFNAALQLVEVYNHNIDDHPLYVSALDALACQVQEDIAVVNVAQDGSNWVSALHLCFPNHWSAEEKIGRDFAVIHEPIPGIGPINKQSPALVNAMINKGPYVRFTWGISTDTRLNHHPSPPPGITHSQWAGRSFSQAQPRLYLRIERQTTWGFPAAHAALFIIRTYFTDCAQIKRDPVKCNALINAIQSMSKESLAYKGIDVDKEDILRWLRE